MEFQAKNIADVSDVARLCLKITIRGLILLVLFLKRIDNRYGTGWSNEDREVGVKGGVV